MIPITGFFKSWSPLDISGCVLWLEADSGVTLVNGVVSSWLDQSSAGNNVSNGTVSQRPLFVEDGLNGHPVLLFDSSDRLNFVASTFAQTSPGTFMVVLDHNTAQSNLGYINRSTSGPPYSTLQMGVNNSGYMNFFSGSWLSDTTFLMGSDPVILRYGWTYGQLYRLSQNNGTEATGNLGYPTLTYWSHIACTSGNLAALAMYNKILSTAEKLDICSYWGLKYGISLS